MRICCSACVHIRYRLSYRSGRGLIKVECGKRKSTSVCGYMCQLSLGVSKFIIRVLTLTIDWTTTENVLFRVPWLLLKMSAILDFITRMNIAVWLRTTVFQRLCLLNWYDPLMTFNARVIQVGILNNFLLPVLVHILFERRPFCFFRSD